MEKYFKEYSECTLCARNCAVNRYEKVGLCHSSAKVRIARADLHHWEEPIISADRGSGTIFFSGCSLGCIYCQNYEISRDSYGREYSTQQLADVMLSLEERGAHNINLVTPTHFAPSIRDAISIARSNGLMLPIVYNTSSIDSLSTLKLLDGYVDIYLPDLKYYRSKTAKELSGFAFYVDNARRGIDEMVRQCPTPIIENGVMKKGVIVRILLLPEHVAEAKLNVKYLYERYGNQIYISLMNQYTPMKNMKPPLNRSVTTAEYSELVSYAEKIGVVNGFIQEGGTVGESFIPHFYK